MTKKPEIFKLITVAFMASGLLAGCATDGTSEGDATMEDTTVSTEQEEMKKGPNAAAKNAIYAAQIKMLRAKRVGYEWSTTDKLLKSAEKAAANGDNEKAVMLANKARAEAEVAIQQSEIEAARYKEQHGPTSLGDPNATVTMDDSSGSMGNGESGRKNRMMSSGSNADSQDFKAANSVSDYTVESGDNLWNISGKDEVYGNPYQWPLIYKANAAKIQDADLIFPGQVFRIPSATSSEVSAAVQHAKTRGAWTIGEAEQSDLNYVLGFK